ncbi:SpoIIE family protein phosphatase [Actinomadura sp. DSM 109109]|nr:SpoIIE family protein phosphatase [Actinomadura lepetitiana]
MEDAGGHRVEWLALEVFDPAPIAVALTVGPEHRLVYTNPAYRAFVGDRPLGESIGAAFGDEMRRDYRRLFDRVLATGEPVNLVEAPVRLASGGQGEERFFSFSISRFLHEGPGVLVVAVDVTDEIASAERAARATDEQRRLRRRFESLVWLSAQLVWVADPAGKVIEASSAWEQVTGQCWEEYRGDGWALAVHPDDRETAMRSWDETRRRARPWRYTYRVRTREGEYRHFDMRAAPVFENGAVVEWVGTGIDVERQWRRRQRKALLDRAAATAAEQTGLEETFAALAHVLVPGLADGCGVHLLPDLLDRPPGVPIVARRIAAAADQELRGEPPDSEQRFAPDSGFARALMQRRPLHRTFPPGRPPEDLLPTSTTNWLAQAGATSVALVPVVVDGFVAAAVIAARRDETAPLGPDDIAVMTQIFEHTHDVLSRAVQFHRTQRVALALQHGQLADPPEPPGLEIVARYLASPAAGEVGGDWYDAFVLPDGATVLAIGDVSGHDLAAAVGMSQLRNMLRALTADRVTPPCDILDRLNHAMETVVPDTTATCVLARVEEPEPGRWRLRHAAAGHPPPLLVTPDGGGRFLDGAVNPLLGAPTGEPYRSSTDPLPRGSTLLLYTDGLVERPREHFDDGLSRLRRQASAVAREPLEDFCDGLLGGLETAGTDDIALLALRVKE